MPHNIVTLIVVAENYNTRAELLTSSLDALVHLGIGHDEIIFDGPGLLQNSGHT